MLQSCSLDKTHSNQRIVNFFKMIKTLIQVRFVQNNSEIFQVISRTSSTLAIRSVQLRKINKWRAAFTSQFKRTRCVGFPWFATNWAFKQFLEKGNLLSVKKFQRRPQISCRLREFSTFFRENSNWDEKDFPKKTSIFQPQTSAGLSSCSGR